MEAGTGSSSGVYNFVFIGNKIKRLRKKHNVNQDELAKYLNVSFQAVSKWENGTAYPDITLIPALANLELMIKLHLIYFTD